MKRNIFYSIALIFLAAAMVFSMTGCSNKEEEKPSVPVSIRTREPEPSEEPEAVFKKLENNIIKAPDGTKYIPYAQQDQVAFFEDFSIWTNYSNYIGYVEGQPRGIDVFEELGYENYEEYLTVEGEIEYGLYALDDGNLEEGVYPEWIFAYFYSREDAVGKNDEDQTKEKTAYFYHREDKYEETFSFLKCSRFVIAEDNELSDKSLLLNDVGLTDPEQIANFTAELAAPIPLALNRIDEMYVDYIYDKYYNKSKDQFKEETEEQIYDMNTRRSFKLIGFMSDNDVFGYAVQLNRYGKFGYTFTLDGAEYIISSRWIPMLVEGVENIPEYLMESTAE